LGMSAAGSAFGTGFAASAAVGAWKKCYAANKPAPFILLGLVGAPITQTLYGMILMFIMLGKNQVQVNMVNKARLLIRESLESDLTIQKVAQELGVSYSNFRKLFKEHTGTSPALYQQDLKLQRAKEMLSATDYSIKEIAYRLNFDSPDYFSSKFRNKTGMKPSEFRNQNR